MRRKKQSLLNSTLNELLMQVLSGIDYVSGLALETRKSIPVVHRQLETLVDLGVLKRTRSGKRVLYTVNWRTYGDLVSSTLFLDIKKMKRLGARIKGTTPIGKEIHALLESIPERLFTDEKALAQMAQRFFEDERASKLTKAFFSDMRGTGEDALAQGSEAFAQSVDALLDTLGMLSEDQRRAIVRETFKGAGENADTFLAYCRLRYLHRQVADPKRRFLAALLGERVPDELPERSA
jgi:hypothetical protein